MSGEGSALTTRGIAWTIHEPTPLTDPDLVVNM
jgi:hypothetical protein